MKLKFNPDGYILPISIALMQQLQIIADKNNIADDAEILVFNFRDNGYTFDVGGYHPVEIAIYMECKMWHFEYITDFSYQGGAFPELAKEVDFDFISGNLNVVYLPSMPINYDIEFFKLWQSNFLAYLESGAFDSIEVSSN